MNIHSVQSITLLKCVINQPHFYLNQHQQKHMLADEKIDDENKRRKKGEIEPSKLNQSRGTLFNWLAAWEEACDLLSQNFLFVIE
jgi:hypothetical protein